MRPPSRRRRGGARERAVSAWLTFPARTLVAAVVYVVVVAALAIAGYMATGWSFGDALYMVVLTVFTVGFDEVHPIDTGLLRGITIGLIVLGCTGMIFLTGALVQFITIAQLQQVLGLARMKSQIDRLQGHVIVCGFGRIGVMLARELRAGKAAFVVIERSEARFAEARDLGYLCLHADATDEQALEHAGVARARLLATVLPDDAANVFITLSARSLNNDLVIIARGEAPSTETKLLQAGANEVVLPAHIGAERLAELILYPGTSHIVRHSDRMRLMEQELHRLGLELELVVAEQGSAFVGMTVAEIEQRAERAFFIVSIERQASHAAMRPDGATRIEPGDGLMIIGRGGRAKVLAGFSGRGS
jgi:Trk K+ transport system NAD-binding subunit